MKKKNMKAKIAVITAALALTVVSGCGNQEKKADNKWGVEELNYVMIPGEDSEKLVQLYDDMEEKMSEALGIPVNIYRANDYNAAVEALRTGNAQMAALGPFSYVTAAERADAECLCVLASNGEKGYKSYFITQPDSDIESLEDLEGKTFAFADPASTSGNVVPCNEILTMLNDSLTFDELHAEGKFFKSATYSGSHINSIQAVVQGNVDAAAVASSTYGNMIAEGLIKEDDLKIFYESPEIPGSPIAVRKDMPQELKDKILEFFLNYQDEELFSLYGDSNTKYMKVEDSEYGYIRELQDKFGLTD